MIELVVDKGTLAYLQSVAMRLGLSGRRQMYIATSQAAQDGKSFIAKRMTKRLAQPQKSIRGMMTIRQTGETGSTLTIKKRGRIPLKALKPKWKKTGVSYKPGSAARKTIEGAFMGPKHPAQFRSFAPGHVFKRQDYEKGKRRRKKPAGVRVRERQYTRNGKTYTYTARIQPDKRGTRPPRPKGYWRKYTAKRKIYKLFWASITHIYIDENIDGYTRQYIAERLQFRLNDRLRVLELKAQGKITARLR
jgi:hypothetical protein